MVDYLDTYLRCELTDEPKRVRALAFVTKAILNNKDAYRAVAFDTGVPWYVVAAIHARESSLNFTRHLHNGDPLTARTTHVPAGRPVKGNPPFTWRESAADALLTAYGKPKAWTLAGSLEFMERYNGLGYRNLGYPSPYLWSFTSEYEAGLFSSDGKFDPIKVCAEPGAAAILKAIQAQGFSLDSLA